MHAILVITSLHYFELSPYCYHLLTNLWTHPHCQFKRCKISPQKNFSIHLHFIVYQKHFICLKNNIIIFSMPTRITQVVCVIVNQWSFVVYRIYTHKPQRLYAYLWTADTRPYTNCFCLCNKDFQECCCLDYYNCTRFQDDCINPPSHV